MKKINKIELEYNIIRLAILKKEGNLLKMIKDFHNKYENDELTSKLHDFNDLINGKSN